MWNTAESEVGQAATLIDLKRAEEALRLLGRAIASDPEDFRARCLLALALIDLDRYPEAIDAAQQAIRIEPEEEWGHRLHSVALACAGKGRPAVKAAERAVALEPEMAEPRIVLAQAFVASGQGREAGVAANEAVRLAPEDASAHAAVGEAALERKDYRAAEEAYRASLALDPEQSMVQNNLGVVLLRLGRRDEAMKAFESSARHDPRDDVGRRNLTATARRFVTGGGWSLPVMAFIALQLVRLAHPKGSDGLTAALVAAGALALAAALLFLLRRIKERDLSHATRALLADERRRNRRRPWTWDPAGRYLPWPLWILLNLPAVVVAGIGGCALVLMLVNSGSYSGGDWAVFAGVAVFTAFFALRACDMPSD
jgi:tetratricopeptide (TPR) repeat protein